MALRQKRFEGGGSSVIIDIPEPETDEVAFSPDTQQILDLWDKYGLGKPPLLEDQDGNPNGVQQRLRVAAKRYVDMAFKVNESVASSNARRQVHNELASILLGELRSNISVAKAKLVADFAFELDTGVIMAEFKRDLDKHSGREA